MARDFGLDFRSGAFAPAERARRHRPDVLERMLRLSQSFAPALGTGSGAAIGGLLGSAAGGIGAVPGAAVGGALGGAVGTAVGGAHGAWADSMGEEDAFREAERVAREEEKRARAQAALNMLGSL